MAAQSRRQHRGGPAFVAGLVVLGVLSVGVWIGSLSRDPRVVILRTTPDGAAWVRVDRPFDTETHQHSAGEVAFRVVFDRSIACREELSLRSLGSASWSLDGRALVVDGGPIDVDLSPGRHEIRVDVVNPTGPGMIRVDATSSELRSGIGSWQATGDGGRSWNAVVDARVLWEPPLPPRFGPTVWELIRWSPSWVGLAVIGGMICRRPWMKRDPATWTRWIVLTALVVLGVNNIAKVPLSIGYDVDSHYEYIRYVSDHRALPPPAAGWQFFQTPAYYVLSAILDRILRGIGFVDTRSLLRLIPLASGWVIAEMCFRTARLVYPDRAALQTIVTGVGALAPVNLYMSQTVSNEPMAAALGSVVVWMTVGVIVRPDRLKCPRRLIAVGAVIGIAALTKLSGVLWLAPVCACLCDALWRRASAGRDWGRLLLVPTAATLIFGGYVVRDWVFYGRPIFRESPAERWSWWQDPGYRVPSNFYKFGHVFSRPIYNGAASLWDGLYGTLWADGIPSGQPPWNYGLMSAGLWLALIPTALFVVGLVVTVSSPSRAALGFSALSVGLFVWAIVHVYLTLPIYAFAKASYAWGTLPCFALLVAAGFDRLPRGGPVRPVVGGLIFSWGLVSYATYFA